MQPGIIPASIGPLTWTPYQNSVVGWISTLEKPAFFKANHIGIASRLKKVALTTTLTLGFEQCLTPSDIAFWSALLKSGSRSAAVMPRARANEWDADKAASLDVSTALAEIPFAVSDCVSASAESSSAVFAFSGSFACNLAEGANQGI